MMNNYDNDDDNLSLICYS